MKQNCPRHTGTLGSPLVCQEGRGENKFLDLSPMGCLLSQVCVKRVQLRKYGVNLDLVTSHYFFYLFVWQTVTEYVLLADIVIGFQNQTTFPLSSLSS